jgi:hypothetical protein
METRLRCLLFVPLLFVMGCSGLVVREEYLRTVETTMSNLPPLGPMAVGPQLKRGQVGVELGGAGGLPASAADGQASLEDQPSNALAPAVGVFGIALGYEHTELGLRFHFAPGSAATAYNPDAVSELPDVGMLSAARLDVRSEVFVSKAASIGMGLGVGVMNVGFEQSTRTLRRGFGLETFEQLARCWPDCTDAQVADSFRQVELYAAEDPVERDEAARFLPTGVGQLGFRYTGSLIGAGFGGAVELTPRAPAIQVFQGVCTGICEGLQLPDGDDYRYTAVLSPYAELNTSLAGLPVSAWVFSSFPVEPNAARLRVGGGLKLRWVFDTL